ncbi:MAG: ABC transporter ATP-binding protein [Deltaproteobacteria bacterium]|nr:ABC transporter ATP-binding protein [Deltaproteobacteria bacterium]MBW2123971.1 ABC transporter ATP-binding protein [Deltaproteobacteria bacterium]
MGILDVDHVFSGYGDVDVLQGVSLAVEANEIVTIIGPNGAGKSTLLKTIMGYLIPTRGTVYFQGENVTRLRPDHKVRKGIGYVPQLRNVFPSLTVEENLRMGGYIEEKRTVKERIDEMYALFPVLGDRKDQRVEIMSGGQRQMVAMAQALMTRPRLLLLDEPSAGLAPMVSDSIFENIEKIRQRGAAVVIVEQDAYRSLAISERGYVLAVGQNVLEDAARSILENDKIRETYLGG